MRYDVWMRAETSEAGRSVCLWRCRQRWRPAVEAHRVYCGLEQDACWALLEALDCLWRPRGILVRWAGQRDSRTVPVPEWSRDLERLQGTAAGLVAEAVEAAARSHQGE